jgi:hypothetical protein
MANDDDEFATPEEVAASGTLPDSTLEDWKVLMLLRLIGTNVFLLHPL